MGMGKIVQAITLVVAQHEIQKGNSYSSISSFSPCTSLKLPIVKETLILCLVVGEMWWFCEIEHCTLKGSNKTLVYHGVKREKCVYKLAEYDFVISTYSTIEANYRPKKLKKDRKNSKSRVDMLDEKIGSVSSSKYMSRRESVLHFVKWDRIILDEVSHIFTDSCIKLFSLIGFITFFIFFYTVLICYSSSWSCY